MANLQWVRLILKFVNVINIIDEHWCFPKIKRTNYRMLFFSQYLE